MNKKVFIFYALTMVVALRAGQPQDILAFQAALKNNASDDILGYTYLKIKNAGPISAFAMKGINAALADYAGGKTLDQLYAIGQGLAGGGAAFKFEDYNNGQPVAEKIKQLDIITNNLVVPAIKAVKASGATQNEKDTAINAFAAKAAAAVNA